MEFEDAEPLGAPFQSQSPTHMCKHEEANADTVAEGPGSM